MKIVHYIPSIDVSSGGVGAYMQSLALELGDLVELHVVTHRSGHELDLVNCKIHYIPANWMWLLSVKKNFTQILDTIRPDVVHVNSCWQPLSAFTQRWAHERGYKTIYTTHGMMVPWIVKHHYYTRKIPALCLYQRKALQTSDYLHATSYYEAQHLQKDGYNSHIITIPTGVNIKEIKVKDNWNIKKQILLLSRIHEVKGLEFLIRSISQLKENFKDYSIIVAGDGDVHYLNYLRKMCSALGVENIIHFIGSVNGKQKWKLYQTSDIFMLLSYTENFGIVVAESLASGTPVIASKGAPWQDLETYNCGYWTEIGTKGTVEALQKFLTLSKSDLETMGKNGRKLIENKYSSKVMAEKMFELYKSFGMK